MKRQYLFAVLICFSVMISESAKAQGGFGGVHAGSEFTNSGNLLLIGGGGAWVINSNFYLGGAGYGGSNTLATSNGELSSIGYGGYSIDDLEEGFFFIEPNLKFWYSVNSYLHLSAGVYYRLAYLNADAVLNQQELNNFGIKLSLNFGSL